MCPNFNQRIKAHTPKPIEDLPNQPSGVIESLDFYLLFNPKQTKPIQESRQLKTDKFFSILYSEFLLAREHSKSQTSPEIKAQAIKKWIEPPLNIDCFRIVIYQIMLLKGHIQKLTKSILLRTPLFGVSSLGPEARPDQDLEKNNNRILEETIKLKGHQSEVEGKRKELGRVENELFREQNFSFRKLVQKDKQAALELLTRAFNQLEPLSNAFYTQFKEQRQFSLFLWNGFWKRFIGDSIGNQMSVAVFDLEKSQQLVGISVAKDLNYVPPGFQQTYMRDLNFMSSIIAFQEEMFKRAKQEHQQLFQKTGLVMDVWGVALENGYFGKKLLNKMIKGNDILGKIQGYQYGFSYASNFKTGIALSKLNYAKISEVECRSFEYRNAKPFALIEQNQSRPSLWLKKLQ